MSLIETPRLLELMSTGLGHYEQARQLQALALLEQRAKQTSDLEMLRAVKAYRAQLAELPPAVA